MGNPAPPSEPSDRPDRSGDGTPALEAVTAPYAGLTDTPAFIQVLLDAQHRIAMVEIAGRPAGTGVLVGGDLLLTAAHVLGAGEPRPLVDGLVAVFDHHATAGTSPAETGIRIPVAEYLDGTPLSTAELERIRAGGEPVAGWLDFALLRLSRPAPGVPQVYGPALPRGHYPLDPTDYAFDKAGALMVVQHPLGGFQKTASTIGSARLEAQGTRVKYQTNTLMGSSGSAVIDPRGRLVAIHHYFTGRANQGVPISAIARALAHGPHAEVIRRDTASHSVAAWPVRDSVFQTAERRGQGWGWRAYREQVRAIAPREGLLDRNGELAGLAGFCSGEAAYWWWRAEAWAGKSALLSWFALHPPSGVVVLSFFITARYASQADSAAFTSAVLGQLKELLGPDLPDEQPTEKGSSYHRLLLLLRDAARSHQERGQRLVLAVDGLDEDQSAGRGLPSVASLLPKHCDFGMKVIVASRPDPDIPLDVPADHPLRDPRIVRSLAPSSHAKEIRAAAEWELRGLLTGTDAQQLLLGLLAAAAGGLTLADLEELTGMAPYEITGILQGVTGRTFTTRAAGWAAGGARQVYLLAHETLQEEAVKALGQRRLGGDRERLHGWADRYRTLGWPAGTPAYLLRGYFPMLQAVGDTARVVACATDEARHDRMLAISGGDAAALREIAAAMDAILVQPDPDLAAMTRLALHRDDLATRNAAIPNRLPAVWVSLGQPDRAEALARSITKPDSRAWALAEVARALAADGQLEEAGRMARSVSEPGFRAWALAGVTGALAAAGQRDAAGQAAGDADAAARSITERQSRAWALAGVTGALAAAGQRDAAGQAAGDADAAARSITEPQSRAWALAGVTGALAAAGQHDAAGQAAGDADAAARSITEPDSRARALARLARALAAAGQHDAAGRAAGDADAAARSITDPDSRAWALAEVAYALAAAGQYEPAERVAGDAVAAAGLAAPFYRALALAEVACARAAAGQHDAAGRAAGDADAAARSITDPDSRARALAEVACALAASGHQEPAERVAGDAEAAARSITDPDSRARELAQTRVRVARELAVGRQLDAAGRVADDAEATARSIGNPDTRDQALEQVAYALAAAGQDQRAEAVSRDTTTPYMQVRVLADVAVVLATNGQHEAARRVAGEAEAVALSITPDMRSIALSHVVEALLAAGQYERVEALARLITELDGQPWKLADTAMKLAAAGQQEAAERMAGHAEVAARSITNPYYLQAQAMVQVAWALAAAGQHERAEATARSITDPDSLAEALAGVARTLAAAGQREAAGGMAGDAEVAARSITDPDSQAQAMVQVAWALAAAGQHKRAEATARSITDPSWQAEALLRVVWELAAAGQHERAEATARSITNPHSQAEALLQVAWELAAAGQHERAEATARSITDPDSQAQALLQVAWELAAAGHHESAEATARSITNPDLQAQALTEVAWELAAAGHETRSRQVVAMALAAGSWTVPDQMLASLELTPLLPISDTYCYELERALASAKAGQYL